MIEERPAGSVGEPADQVMVLLGRALGALTEAGGDRGWACSNQTLRERVRLADRVLAVAEGVRLAGVRALQARPEAVPGADGGKAGATFLVHGCRVSPWQAGRDVAAAQACDPDDGMLPLLGAALAAGEVSRAHLDVAVAAVARIPAGIRKLVLCDGRTGMERVDEFLVGYCRTHPPTTVRQLCHELVHLLDPDRGEDLTPDAVARRELRYRSDADTGMLRGSFALDPAAGSQFVAALEALSTPTADGTARTLDGDCEQLPDLRSRPQRLADGLTSMAELAMSGRDPDGAGATGAPEAEAETRAGTGSDSGADSGAGADASSGSQGPAGSDRAGAGGGASSPAPTAGAAGAGTARRRARADIAVVATWEQLVAAGLAPAMPGFTQSKPAAGLARMTLAGGGDRHGSCLSPATLARLACDGIWRRVIVSSTGIPLDVGRGQRLATTAQRTALAVRDGGCIIPGCAMPISWCDIHHHQPWADGGATDLDNLYPLCGRHHTEVHARVWQIEWIDALPWVRPPRWLHRAQPLMRNTTHDTRRAAHAFAQQLALDVEAARTDWLPHPTEPPTTDPPTTEPPTTDPPDGGGREGGGSSSAACVRRRDRVLMAPRARPPDRQGRSSPNSPRFGHPPMLRPDLTPDRQ